MREEGSVFCVVNELFDNLQSCICVGSWVFIKLQTLNSLELSCVLLLDQTQVHSCPQAFMH